MKIKLKGNLVTPSRVIPHGEVCIENNKITYAGIAQNTDGSYAVTDYGDDYIAPGFIDLHLHGGAGSDFMDGTEKAFLNIAALHASHGTTSLLATTLTCPDEELFHLLDLYREVTRSHPGTALAGLHLEGPYFSPGQKGAQDERFLKKPTPAHYLPILEKGNGIIKRWSIAPELDGAMALGKECIRRGILPSMGHSDAEYETALEAYDNGFSHLTHFYSGMSTIVRIGGFRHPGLIESGYMIDGLTVEIIADGCHLPPSLLRYIYKAKGADKVALVTDALRGAGTTEKEMIIGSPENGYKVIIEDGVAKLPDRSAFAGSIATADRLVRSMLTYADCGISDAVRMMTATPAKIMGWAHKGILAEGFDADIAVFDRNINIHATYIQGKKFEQ